MKIPRDESEREREEGSKDLSEEWKTPGNRLTTELGLEHEPEDKT